ncbi:hypothetical protein B0A48_12601 [Cryoendolithus antarcticus]|uniref:Uncharacterized protein n=1 Tax=Cryoendolithus antarcticus TaxID=1507870 RepID=A0A1V8SQW0_9PEZI|nr:hypothetical protein B0A48_12601 [Cryoendolithus antarcticus]
MSAPGQPGQPKEDYLDKGLDAVEKKFGGQVGHGVNDPNKMRSTNEKITDKARGVFEKATGKHVPDKVSN